MERWCWNMSKMRKKVKCWEGISVYTKVADVNVKTRQIEGFQQFKTCLKNVKADPNECINKYNCIIAKMIIALQKRGAKL